MHQSFMLQHKNWEKMITIFAGVYAKISWVIAHDKSKDE
jgi:hypothetical protein